MKGNVYHSVMFALVELCSLCSSFKTNLWISFVLSKDTVKYEVGCVSYIFYAH